MVPIIIIIIIITLYCYKQGSHGRNACTQSNCPVWIYLLWIFNVLFTISDLATRILWKLSQMSVVNAVIPYTAHLHICVQSILVVFHIWIHPHFVRMKKHKRNARACNFWVTQCVLMRQVYFVWHIWWCILYRWIRFNKEIFYRRVFIYPYLSDIFTFRSTAELERIAVYSNSAKAVAFLSAFRHRRYDGAMKYDYCNRAITILSTYLNHGAMHTRAHTFSKWEIYSPFGWHTLA